MKKLKVLNLYAGIGGNRKLWEDVEVTAVEINEEIAQVYTDNFPNDKMIVGDAHQYLLDHYKEFDLIWASRPCQTHSRANYWANAADNRTKPYPDLTLYQEIIFLQNYFKGEWVSENVIPYYTPLIPPTKQVGRHLFWASFPIGNFEANDSDIHGGTIREWEKHLGYDLSKYKFKNRKDQILRNCVHPETGLYILDCARGIIRKQNEKQLTLL